MQKKRERLGLRSLVVVSPAVPLWVVLLAENQKRQMAGQLQLQGKVGGEKRPMIRDAPSG